MNSIILRRLIAAPKYQTIILRTATASMPVFRMPMMRCFTTGQLNENEVIELVEGKVFEVLKSAAKCNHSKLSRTATFEELGFDSLDGVELVLAMEEHFGFDLSNQDAEKITSVMDAIQIFHTYQTKRMQPAEEASSQ